MYGNINNIFNTYIFDQIYDLSEGELQEQAGIDSVFIGRFILNRNNIYQKAINENGLFYLLIGAFNPELKLSPNIYADENIEEVGLVRGDDGHYQLSVPSNEPIITITKTPLVILDKDNYSDKFAMAQKLVNLGVTILCKSNNNKYYAMTSCNNEEFVFSALEDIDNSGIFKHHIIKVSNNNFSDESVSINSIEQYQNENKVADLKAIAGLFDTQSNRVSYYELNQNKGLQMNFPIVLGENLCGDTFPANPVDNQIFFLMV